MRSLDSLRALEMTEGGFPIWPGSPLQNTLTKSTTSSVKKRCKNGRVIRHPAPGSDPDRPKHPRMRRRRRTSRPELPPGRPRLPCPRRKTRRHLILTHTHSNQIPGPTAIPAEPSSPARPGIFYIDENLKSQFVTSSWRVTRKSPSN